MKNFIQISTTIGLVVMSLSACSIFNSKTPQPIAPVTIQVPSTGSPSLEALSSVSDELFKTISTLDARVFDAFNQCSSPEALKDHEDFFASDVEFYHDTGGVTWSRAEMIADTKNYACGKFRRELIPETLKVFPIKNFGAIEQGEHQFCRVDSSNCDGRANFMIVWRHENERWEITRVFSYAHKENK